MMNDEFRATESSSCIHNSSFIIHNSKVGISMKKSKLLLVVGLGWAVALPLVAVQTSFWQVGSFQDFVQGTLDGVSVSKNGELKLAPETRALFSPDENIALSLAGDGHNSLYVGTGHEGKVFRVD